MYEKAPTPSRVVKRGFTRDITVEKDRKETKAERQPGKLPVRVQITIRSMILSVPNAISSKRHHY